MSQSPFETLVTVTELSRHIDNQQWRIFDCRHRLAAPDYGQQAYHQGHIPHAVFLHLDRDLSGTKTGKNGRHPLPDPQTLANCLGHWGVDESIQVVAYDDQGGMFAARLWWLLRWLGHRRVAVLDGGFPAWLAAGLPLETVVPSFSPAHFVIQPGVTVLNADAVLTHLHQGDRLIIDARSGDRFAGENETLDPVGGHIPGAVNRFFGQNLNANGYFKSPEQLRGEFEPLLAERPANTIIHQCGSGVTACHNLLAMEIAGLTGSCLYAGSWSEWCADPSRPMVTQTNQQTDPLE